METGSFARALALICLGALGACGPRPEVGDPSRVYFGVLGDSDSHSFHDRVMLADAHLRGGAFRDVTFQWTEVIARLRPQQIDMGEWDTWGVPNIVAAALDRIGIDVRAPRKQDYRFNFAVTGARCENLTTGPSRQAQRLVALMDREPAAWASGIVTLRIGINSLGMREPLGRYAQSGLSTAARAEVDQCAGYVRDAIALIRARHPTTRIVLIGILNNSDFIPWIDHWQTPAELHNIATVMDAYDAALKQFAERDEHMLFWDDRAWFARYFGDRDDSGKPRYHATQLGGPTPVTYTRGDAPTNAILTDNHAGTVWNGLWARDLLDALNRRFGYRFTPIDSSEIGALADPDGKLGIAAPR